MEIKVFNGARQGGIGFGNRKGEGTQVDLLIHDYEQLKLLDDSVRWIIVDATLPSRSSRYIIVSSELARAAAMDVIKREKQNNFKINALRKHAVTWDVFCEQLAKFLLDKL